MRAVLAVAVATLMMSGCIEVNKTFVCSTNEQCVSGTVQGVCDPTTDLCVFADDTCESGTRYGELSGADSNQCTAAVVDAGPIEDLRFVGVVAGSGHTCALEETGRIFCWGDNRRGQTSASTLEQGTGPTEVSVGGVATTITAGAEHTCALVDANIYCWGDDSSGQLGIGSVATGMTTTPQQIDTLVGVIDVDAGDRHTCAIIAGGSAYCWGDDDLGQLGDDDELVDKDTPTLVDTTDGATYTRLALGAGHTCAAKRMNTSYGLNCWGANTNSQLGVDTGGLPATTPTETIALTNNAIDPRAGGDCQGFALDHIAVFRVARQAAQAVAAHLRGRAVRVQVDHLEVGGP